MEVLSATLVAFLVPSLAAAVNLAISKFLLDKKKEIVITKRSGQQEVLRVSALATDSKVLSIVRRSLAFEDEVYKVLQDIAKQEPGLSIHHGKLVDFIVEFKNLRIAIECKYLLDRASSNSISDYLREDGDIDKLLVLTRQSISQEKIAEKRSNPASNRVDFISIGSGMNVEDTVKSLMSNEFPMPAIA